MSRGTSSRFLAQPSEAEEKHCNEPYGAPHWISEMRSPPTSARQNPCTRRASPEPPPPGVRGDARQPRAGDRYPGLSLSAKGASEERSRTRLCGQLGCLAAAHLRRIRAQRRERGARDNDRLPHMLLVRCGTGGSGRARARVRCRQMAVFGPRAMSGLRSRRVYGLTL